MEGSIVAEAERKSADSISEVKSPEETALFKVDIRAAASPFTTVTL